jgi:hypothetical protein
VLERVRLLVDLVPRDLEHGGQEGLDQPMARDDLLRDLAPVRREVQALALVPLHEPVVDEAPDHLRDARLRDVHAAREVRLGRLDPRLLEPEELLEVVLLGFGQRHAASIERVRGRPRRAGGAP